MAEDDKHDPETCEECDSAAREKYDLIDNAIITFLKETFDEKAFPQNETNLSIMAKVLMHRSAHIAIQCGYDLPSFIANAAHEMLEAQQCVYASKMQERLETVFAVMARGNKPPEEMN